MLIFQGEQLELFHSPCFLYNPPVAGDFLDQDFSWAWKPGKKNHLDIQEVDVSMPSYKKVG